MTKVCSEAFIFHLMPDILNTDMQIVVFDDLQFSLVFWSVPVIGSVILVQCVQINIKCEGSFLFYSYSRMNREWLQSFFCESRIR